LSSSSCGSTASASTSSRIFRASATVMLRRSLLPGPPGPAHYQHTATQLSLQLPCI
jgi:hypothetical protein